MVSADAVAVDDRETVDDRWATFAETLAIEARENPFVGNWRAYHLPTEGLLSRDAAPAFLEQLAVEPRRWLEQIAASLVEWHGWWDPDEAALFVLSGAVPTGRRLRTNIIVRDRVGASRVIIEADPRASPQAVAESYRNARSAETLAPLKLPKNVADRHRLNGARPHPLTEKSAELALHLARHRRGNWAQRREGWNETWEQTKPEWTYEADSGFARDAGRAWAQVVGEDFAHKQPTFRHPRLAHGCHRQPVRQRGTAGRTRPLPRSASRAAHANRCRG